MSVHGRILALVCRWHRRTLSLLAADALAEGEGRRVRSHLKHCSACQKRFAELRAVVELGGHLSAGMDHAEIAAPLPRVWEQTIRARGREPVRDSVRVSCRPRLAWSGLAAAWLVIGVLRWTAPGVSTSDAGPAPISWGQVRIVLGLADRREEARRETAPLPRQPLQTPSKAIPDRNQGAGLPSDNRRRMG